MLFLSITCGTVASFIVVSTVNTMSLFLDFIILLGKEKLFTTKWELELRPRILHKLTEKKIVRRKN